MPDVIERAQARWVDPPARPAISPSTQARIAGALYCVFIASGALAELFVRAKLVVFSDAAAPAHNIATAPELYRLGLLADFTMLTTGLIVGILFYQLLKPVNCGVALLALMFLIVSNTESPAGLIHLFAPLMLLDGADSSHPVPLAQLQLMSRSPYGCMRRRSRLIWPCSRATVWPPAG